MRKGWVLVVMLAACGLPCRAMGNAEPSGRITVVAEATVDADVVLLANIAHLEGAELQALGKLEMGRAPAPGRARSISGAGILATLRGQGVDLDRVRYVIPRIVRIRRRAQEIPATTIREIVEQYLMRRLQSENRQVMLRGVDVPAPVRIAPGPYATRVTPQRGAPLAGRTRLLVEFLQHERVAGSVGVTANIAVFADVYVLRQGIARGAILTPEDLVLEARDVTTLPRGLVASPDEVVGMEAKASLAPSTALRRQQFGRAALVHRGEVVTLLVESSRLKITASGEIRGDAPLGGQVRVLNRSSHSEVVGRVVDEGTVAVTF